MDHSLSLAHRAAPSRTVLIHLFDFPFSFSNYLSGFFSAEYSNTRLNPGPLHRTGFSCHFFSAFATDIFLWFSFLSIFFLLLISWFALGSLLFRFALSLAHSSSCFTLSALFSCILPLATLAFETWKCMNLFTVVFSSRSVEVDRADRLTPAEDYLREYTLSCMLIDEAYIVVQNQPGAGGAPPPPSAYRTTPATSGFDALLAAYAPPTPIPPPPAAGAGAGVMERRWQQRLPWEGLNCSAINWEQQTAPSLLADQQSFCTFLSIFVFILTIFSAKNVTICPYFCQI